MKNTIHRPRTALCTTLATACLAFISLAAAQAPGNAPPAGGVVVEKDPRAGIGAGAKQSARQQLNAFMKERRLNPGWNEEAGLFIAIGSDAISQRCGEKGFANSRSIAFDMAMMNAKKEMARFIGTEVERQLERIVAQAPEGELARVVPENTGPVPRDLVEKALTVLHDVVDAQLDEWAKNAGTKNADQIEQDKARKQEERERASKLIMRKEFKDTLNLFADAAVSGMQAYRTFESTGDKGGEIAVVAAYSKASGELAMALLGKGAAPKGSIPDKSIEQWVDGLATTDLLYTQGAQIRTDKNGEVVIVAFGMSTPQFDDPDLNQEARDAACEQAFGAARLLVGSMVESNVNSSRGQTVEKYSDEYSKVQDTSRRLTTLKERAQKLVLRGGAPIRQWEEQHPCVKDGVLTYGCVIKFSLTGAQAANALGDLMKSMDGWRGGKGVTSGPSKAPSAPAPGKPAPRNTSGAGVEGELNPGGGSGPNGGAGAPGLR